MTELIVIIGPSGAGKSALARALHDRGAVTLWPTWTTRPRRPGEVGPGEVGSVDHVFVTAEVFEEQERRGAFVATAHLPGLDHRYGLPRPVLDRRRPPPAVIARAEQVPGLRRLAPDVTVVAVTADRAAVATRLAGRDLPLAEHEARLAAHEAETAAACRVADHVVANRATVQDLAVRVAQLIAPPSAVRPTVRPGGRWWVRPAPLPPGGRTRGQTAAVTVVSIVGAAVALVAIAYVAFWALIFLIFATGGLNSSGSNK